MARYIIAIAFLVWVWAVTTSRAQTRDSIIIYSTPSHYRQAQPPKDVSEKRQIQTFSAPMQFREPKSPPAGVEYVKNVTGYIAEKPQYPSEQKEDAECERLKALVEALNNKIKLLERKVQLLKAGYKEY